MLIAWALLIANGPAVGQTAAAQINPPNMYPPALAEALLKRKQAEAEVVKQTPHPAAFAFVSTNFLWPAGQKLIVAFHGGRYEVWTEIAKIADQWSAVANITFDFGLDPKAKTARMWNPSDPTAGPAHVRIRLDVDIASLRYAAVGREAFLKEFESGSLVLGGIAASFPLWSPADRADILHEFGHVLGFLHEQQRPECSKEFRLQPGPKGEPTIFQVYEQLYNWDVEKTQLNLMLSETYKGETSGKPDKRSLFMYPTDDPVLVATLHGTNGPCYVKNKNLQLSQGDIARARRDYPFHTDNSITSFASSNIETLKQVAGESVGELAASPLLQRLQNIEKALRPLIYVQVATQDQRAAGSSLRRRLQDSGYLVPSIEVIAGKAIPPNGPEVRYFASSDAGQARSVANLLQTELGGSSVATRFIPRIQERKLPLEVWLPRAQ